MVRVRRAAKKRGGAKIKRGCEKKGGARSTGTPPVYAPVSDQYKSETVYVGCSPRPGIEKGRRGVSSPSYLSNIVNPVSRI